MKPAQILVELLLAIGVAVLTLVALIGATTRSLFNAGFAQRQSVATNYAQGAMEWIRTQKGLSWESFFARADGQGRSYCLADLAWNSSAPCPALPGSEFVRTARLTVLSASPPQQVETVVTVTWQEANRPVSSKQTTVFTQY